MEENHEYSHDNNKPLKQLFNCFFKTAIFVSTQIKISFISIYLKLHWCHIFFSHGRLSAEFLTWKSCLSKPSREEYIGIFNIRSKNCSIITALDTDNNQPFKVCDLESYCDLNWTKFKFKILKPKLQLTYLHKPQNNTHHCKIMIRLLIYLY